MTTVTGTLHSAPRATPEGAPEGHEGGGGVRESVATVALVATLLLVLRALAASFGAFVEGDDFSIAAGIAAIRNGSVADLYRYGPQVGYYRLVGLLSTFAGPDLTRIHAVMVWLSVLAGTVIPVAGLFTLQDDLSRLQRRTLFLVLAANPILWMSSRYGNTAMPSVALVVTAMVILSNRPRRLGETLALVAFGAAIVIRADAVLATGGIGMLLWRNHRSFRAASLRVAIVGAAVAATFAAFVASDPRMRPFVSAVASHLTNEFPSYFWDYLIWALSPVPLIFAVLGGRRLALGDRWIAAWLTAWAVPPALFYYGAITTPRYFLLFVFPIAVAAALGIAGAIAGSTPRRAWRTAGVLAVANVHLLVALGHTVPARDRSWLRDGSFPTHDGPMWTGAFVYKSYVKERPWEASVFSAPLAEMGPAFRSLRRVFGALAERGGASPRVVLVVDRAWPTDLDFAAELAHARTVSRTWGSDSVSRRTEYAVGEAQLTTFNVRELQFDSTATLPVSAGTELWIVVRDEAVERTVRERLPRGVRITALPPIQGATRLTRYRVEEM